MIATRPLVQHIRLKAPTSRVYAALTEEAQLLKWFPDRATVDARVGGAWNYEFETSGGCAKAQGTFLALVPDQLVRYNWVGALDAAGAEFFNLTIEFRLVAQGDETDLYLEEVGYGEGADYARVFGERTNGWAFFMENLTSYLAGGADLRAD